MKNKAVYITKYNCITPIGFDVETNWNSLQNGVSGIQQHQNVGLLDSFYASVIPNTELEKAFEQIESKEDFSKLEKMLILALKPLVDKNEISSKTAFIFSTTKGNISFLQQKETPIESAHLSALAKKISTYFGLASVPVVVSNACVSGVMAVSVAKRLIQTGMYENAFIVAGDEVSEFVLSGFNSFQAMSASPCKPYDANRNGVTLGEAAAAVFVTANRSETQEVVFEILGDGSINDANHISGPSRTGEGLYRSINSAMNEAGMNETKIDFISAHGTATLYNDEMEAIAFNRLNMNATPVNSLKGYYGHTLGTSGLLETVIAMESAKRNQLVVSKGYEKSGVSQPINVVTEGTFKEINCFLKTASGFGGCNTAVVFQKIK